MIISNFKKENLVAGLRLTTKRRLWLIALVLGVGLRLWFVLAPNSSDLTFHSGGSDAPAYVILAQNLIAHRGFSYADAPSAFRPAAFPLLLASLMLVFGGKYIIALRLCQFILGLLAIGLCYLAALKLFDRRTAQVSAIIGLFLPTLIFTTAQVLTECIASFLTALYLYFLTKQLLDDDVGSAWGLGLTAGIESLFRFNAAVLPVFSAWAAWRSGRAKSRWTKGLIVLVVPLLIVLPWIIRNEVVFHGRVLYSTQIGMNAVRGVLNSEGRRLTDDRLLNTTGWIVQDLETNDPSRLGLGSEAQLNEKTLRLVPGLWRNMGYRLIPLAIKKTADFWLSTDQLFDTESFATRERVLRVGGVLMYWIVLGLAVYGWFHLKPSHSNVANTFLVYAIGLTLLHLPLVMNTRLRIPLLEPLLVCLSGAGSMHISALRGIPHDGKLVEESEGHR